MRIVGAVACLLGAWTAFAAAGAGPAPKREWKTHRGPFFSVRHPSGFKARAVKDGVFVASPDGAAEFYVYSPLWWGAERGSTPSDLPAEIAPDSKREKLVSEATEPARIARPKKEWQRGTNPTEVRRLEVRAKDGSYRRSYAEWRNVEQNTRVIFGFRCNQDPACERYRPDFAAFQDSLRQYAD